MRPIFSPSARARVRSPVAVGAASRTGGSVVPAFFADFLLPVFARGATATAVGAVVGCSVAFSSGPLVSFELAKSGSGGLVAAATCCVVAFDAEGVVLASSGAAFLAVVGFWYAGLEAEEEEYALSSSFSTTT